MNSLFKFWRSESRLSPLEEGCVSLTQFRQPPNRIDTLDQPAKKPRNSIKTAVSVGTFQFEITPAAIFTNDGNIFAFHEHETAMKTGILILKKFHARNYDQKEQKFWSSTSCTTRIYLKILITKNF